MSKNWITLQYLSCSLRKFWTINSRWLRNDKRFPYNKIGDGVLVFDATFNYMFVISWWSVWLVEETRENYRHAANHWQTLSHNVVSEYTSPERDSNYNVNGDRHCELYNKIEAYLIPNIIYTKPRNFWQRKLDRESSKIYLFFLKLIFESRLLFGLLCTLQISCVWLNSICTVALSRALCVDLKLWTWLCLQYTIKFKE